MQLDRHAPGGRAVGARLTSALRRVVPARRAAALGESWLALERLGYRAAHRGLRTWWFLRRPRTRGVKCVVRDGGRVLYVRHTYGDRRAWEIPGGGLRRREAPEAAVRREMREELGVELEHLRPIGRVEAAGYHKRTLLHCFTARPGGGPLKLAAAEIAEARWASPETPPQPLGPDAAALLGLLREAVRDDAPPPGADRDG